MKGKILVALKTKYKTFGFSDKVFDGVADYLSKTVTEEGQIETAIGGVEGLLKAFQGDVDFVRNEKSGLQKELDALKVKIENPNLEEKPDMAKLIADAVSAAVKPLSDELSGFRQKETQAQRSSQIMVKAKEYGIPENFVPILRIADDADLDTFFKDAKQTFVNEGFQGVRSPESTEQKMEKENDAIVKMINDGTKTIVEQK